MDAKINRMKELVKILQKAAKIYYAQDDEIMSNYEYDRLCEELQLLEQETGLVLAGSPTITVGYEAVEELPKERHESAMLSLDKTKNRQELRDWLQDHKGLLSWKLDGLTVVLTYRDGQLQKAVTRGNGEIGEVITANARTFQNLPLQIAYQGELVLRGEAVISYSDFEKMNQEMAESEKYKNPRNLCSGSVRQLNNEITAKRKVQFFAFQLVSLDANVLNGQQEAFDSKEAQFAFLRQLGFAVVDFMVVTKETILEAIETFEQNIKNYDIPSDGLVLTYDCISYGQSLGQTAKFPRHSIAFKWSDELRETVLTKMEWSASRTGLINPIAVFEPVELEGTTVSRASVHNLSILKALKLGIGDHITVYKANMIIPQIAENRTQSDTIEIPQRCPVCGQATQIRQVNEGQFLYCANSRCAAKRIKAFTQFVSRDALNVEGLSEATLEKFMAAGFIHEFADLFHLDRYHDEIVRMEGFGEKSFQNLLDNMEKARHTTLPRLLYGLGIANIGVANAKVLCRYFEDDMKQLQNADVDTLSEIEGVGPVIAAAFVDYMQNTEHLQKINRLMEEVAIEKASVSKQEQQLFGQTFVITGSLQHYASRNELKEIIEQKGGKVAGSVSAKTTCLINNDIASQSSKNKKAKELQIPILTEEDFIQQYL